MNKKLTVLLLAILFGSASVHSMVKVEDEQKENNQQAEQLIIEGGEKKKENEVKKDKKDVEQNSDDEQSSASSTKKEEEEIGGNQGNQGVPGPMGMLSALNPDALKEVVKDIGKEAVKEIIRQTFKYLLSSGGGSRDMREALAVQAMNRSGRCKSWKSVVQSLGSEGIRQVFKILPLLLQQGTTGNGITIDRKCNIKGKKTIHKFLGKLEVLAIFKSTKKSMIIGGKITEGKITKTSKIKVLKNGRVETIGELLSLQAAKEDVAEVVEGNEAGLEYKGEPIIEVGDTLEFFEEIYE